MMIKTLFTILCLFLASPCWSATQQVLISGSEFALDAAATEYSTFYGVGDRSDWTLTEADVKGIFPATGTIKDFRVKLEADPTTATSSYKFTVRVNEAEPGSPITCTVSVGSTTCQSAATTTITSGDYVSIEVVPTNTPVSTTARWSATWNPTTNDETVLIGGGGSTIIGNSTSYVSMTGMSGPDATEFDKSFIAPTAGVFKNLYVKVLTAPGGAGKTRTFSFRDSASAETINCTITNAETSCNSTLETETATATAGERFVLVATVANTPADTIVKASIVFVPTTSGEWIIGMGSDDDLHTTSTEYYPIAYGDTSWGGTEASNRVATQTGSFSSDMIIKNMYVQLETDPGVSGDIFAFTLRANTADATATLTATCDGVTTCNAAATVTISDDYLMATQSVPTSSPTVGSALISYTGFITPSSAAARRVILIQ